MKRSTKAVLWSALVFPGFGHLYLKQYVRGVLLVLCAVTALYVVASTAVHTAIQVAEEMERGGVRLDGGAVTQLAAKRSQGTASLTNAASLAFLAVWLVGLGDAYRLGRRRDRAEDREDQAAI